MVNAMQKFGSGFGVNGFIRQVVLVYIHVYILTCTTI